MTDIFRGMVLVLCVSTAGAEEPGVRIFQRHEGTVRPAFSPDGMTIATASDDQTVKLRDVATGKDLRTLTGHGSGVWRAVWSPDGKLLASIADRRVFLWNPAEGQLIRSFEGHGETIRAVAFSPDGEVLATGGSDETVRLWEVASGKLLRAVKIERQGELWEGVWSVAFAPDGRSLAVASGNGVGGDGRVRIVDPASGEVLRVFDGPGNGQVWAVAFSRDGKRLVYGSILGGRLVLRDTETWEVLREWAGGGNLRALVFSPDGQTIAAGIDREIILWDTASGKEQRRLTGHENWIMQIAFAPDGKLLVSGGSDRTARLWTLK